jgi:hypothetical protein
MDDKLIIFKYAGIFFMYGDGPAADGSNNDFSTAQLITSDTGAINWQSVVLTPMGVMYQSQKGIYLLDRSLGTGNYIGAPVENLIAGYTVVSSFVVPDQNQVRFILSPTAGDSTETTILVFDYLVQQWTSYTTELGAYPLYAAAVYQPTGTIAMMANNGRIFYEDPTSYLDNGNKYAMGLTTGWLSMAGIQGFQRLWKFLILGEWLSSHTLYVEIAYDYNDNQIQYDQIPVGSSLVPYQFRINSQYQKCAAVQISISETPGGTNGASMSLANLALEVGTEGGVQRIGSSNTYA